MISSVGMMIPNIWKKTEMFQTSNQRLNGFETWIFSFLRSSLDDFNNESRIDLTLELSSSYDSRHAPRFGAGIFYGFVAVESSMNGKSNRFNGIDSIKLMEALRVFRISLSIWKRLRDCHQWILFHSGVQFPEAISSIHPKHFFSQ